MQRYTLSLLTDFNHLDSETSSVGERNLAGVNEERSEGVDMPPRAPSWRSIKALRFHISHRYDAPAGFGRRAFSFVG